MSSVFEDFRPDALGRVASFGRFIGRHWFRYEIDGLENLPDGPCLVVGNHSGFGFVEELMFATTWHDQFPTRRAWGLIHSLFLDLPLVGAYYRAIGAIEASPENARAALDRGDVVLVFPGGDRDCCRPFYEPTQVNFGDRRGYIRLALETGLPVVPLATTGSHWTWTFLPGGRELARLGWVRRLLRTDCVPIPTALVMLCLAAVMAALGLEPWWTVTVVAMIGLVPTPVRVATQLGPPIDLVARTRHAEDRIEAGHEIVHSWLNAAVQPSIVSMTSRKRAS